MCQLLEQIPHALQASQDGGHFTHSNLACTHRNCPRCTTMLTYMNILSYGPHAEKHNHRSLVPYLTNTSSSERGAKVRDEDLSQRPTYSIQTV